MSPIEAVRKSRAQQSKIFWVAQRTTHSARSRLPVSTGMRVAPGSSRRSWSEPAHERRRLDGRTFSIRRAWRDGAAACRECACAGAGAGAGGGLRAEVCGHVTPGRTRIGWHLAQGPFSWPFLVARVNKWQTFPRLSQTSQDLRKRRSPSIRPPLPSIRPPLPINPPAADSPRPHLVRPLHSRAPASNHRRLVSGRVASHLHPCSDCCRRPHLRTCHNNKRDGPSACLRDSSPPPKCCLALALAATTKAQAQAPAPAGLDVRHVPCFRFSFRNIYLPHPSWSARI